MGRISEGTEGERFMRKWVTAAVCFLMIFLLHGRVEGAGKRKIAIDPGHQGSWVDMSAQEAAQLKEYMTSVVEYGTASVLSGQSYTAAGKTGTAEYSSDKEKDHSWFIGMSNVDDPQLVVSIIIEASDGTAKAVNVAKQIFDAYYY